MPVLKAPVLLLFSAYAPTAVFAKPVRWPPRGPMSALNPKAVLEQPAARQFDGTTLRWANAPVPPAVLPLPSVTVGLTSICPQVDVVVSTRTSPTAIATRRVTEFIEPLL